jgi:hypothetical protein
LIGIISSFIIHRANKEDDAMVYAGLTGKEMKKKFVQNVEHQSGRFDAMGKGAGTGGGRVEEVEEFRVTPNEIQELSMGEFIYLSKAPVLTIERVLCIPENIIEEIIPDDDNYTPLIDSSYAAPLPSIKVDKFVEEVKDTEEPERIRFTSDDEPLVMPDIPSEGRMSDPEKLAKILNKDADIEIQMPKLPQRPRMPDLKSASEVTDDQTSSRITPPSSVSNNEQGNPLLKNKPGLPTTKPNTDEKDEFEF